LSLSGRFARFGTEAANGLRLWAEEAGTELTIVDDRSDPDELRRRLSSIALEVDLLFGPYSTVLTRAAVPIAERSGRLLVNHGGAGGGMNHPGMVMNILTPARRYAMPFVERLARVGGGLLVTAAGRGAFGRDVVDGAVEAGRSAGLRVQAMDFGHPPSGVWDLLSAGVYEDDIAMVRAARALAEPPRHVGSVAAGVASFGHDVEDAEGVFGIGQWAPGSASSPGTPGSGDTADPGGSVDAGMDEPGFLRAWGDRFGGEPDYPAVQAYAAGVIASAAMEKAESSTRQALWRAVRTLDITTVFGRFRIDPDTGEQVGHAVALTRWRGGRQQNQPF
jgi:ABC-type branched-subunit amino acid transport system substrate-binding protein